MRYLSKGITPVFNAGKKGLVLTVAINKRYLHNVKTEESFRSLFLGSRLIILVKGMPNPLSSPLPVAGRKASAG